MINWIFGVDAPFWRGVVAIIGGIFLLVIILVTPFALWHDSMVEDMKARCEAKNGVLLERTYRAGKTTASEYTCVKKDTIVEY